MDKKSEVNYKISQAITVCGVNVWNILHKESHYLRGSKVEYWKIIYSTKSKAQAVLICKQLIVGKIKNLDQCDAMTHKKQSYIEHKIGSR